MIAGDQLVRVRRIQVQALRLTVRSMRSVEVGSLIPVEPQPPEIVEDAQLRLAGRSLGVGVFDPQDKGAVLPVREQPVEQRRARVADMQLPGRTWCETYSHE